MRGLQNLKRQRSIDCYMNKTFVKTQNVRNFIGLIENLQNKPKNIPKMALVYGEPGLGKSQTALWLACKYDAIYLRAANLMSVRWLLEELVKEMDEIPSYLSSNNYNIIVRKLKAKPQLVIIDEIDYLMNDFKTIETLRDIHDKTECICNKRKLFKRTAKFYRKINGKINDGYAKQKACKSV